MTATDRALELVRTAAQAASDKQAENIVAFDVSEQLVITDAFLLASASNDRQVKAIVDAIEDGAARHRRQARAPRGRARRPLGAHRLRRHRRARPARGGAVLLRPRAALARLPADLAARHGHLRPGTVTPGRSLVLLRHGRTAWNESSGPRGTRTSSSTTSGTPRRPPSRRAIAALAAGRALDLRPGAGAADLCVRRGGDRSPGQAGPAAPGVRRRRPPGADHGPVLRVVPGRRRRPGRPAPACPRWRARRAPPTSPSAWCRRCASASPRWSRGRPAWSSPTAPRSRSGWRHCWAGRSELGTTLQGMDNCGWAVLSEVEPGGRRAPGGLQPSGGAVGRWARPTSDPISHPSSTLAKIPELPWRSSGRRGCGAAGSAPPWHGGGQGFESPQLHRHKGRFPREPAFRVPPVRRRGPRAAPAAPRAPRARRSGRTSRGRPPRCRPPRSAPAGPPR